MSCSRRSSAPKCVYYYCLFVSYNMFIIIMYLLITTCLLLLCICYNSDFVSIIHMKTRDYCHLFARSQQQHCFDVRFTQGSESCLIYPALFLKQQQPHPSPRSESLLKRNIAKFLHDLLLLFPPTTLHPYTPRHLRPPHLRLRRHGGTGPD